MTAQCRRSKQRQTFDASILVCLCGTDRCLRSKIDANYFRSGARLRPRRPWRSWAPPIFGNVFCPEDLEEHFQHLYRPSPPAQYSRQDLGRGEGQVTQNAPAAHHIHGKPQLVINPDGRELCLARQLNSGQGTEPDKAWSAASRTQVRPASSQNLNYNRT